MPLDFKVGRGKVKINLCGSRLSDLYGPRCRVVIRAKDAGAVQKPPLETPRKIGFLGGPL